MAGSGWIGYVCARSFGWPEIGEGRLATTTDRKVGQMAGIVFWHLEDWRQIFYERHTGGKPKSKEAAFRWARERLVNKGLIDCKNDNYSLNDRAT